MTDMILVKQASVNRYVWRHVWIALGSNAPGLWGTPCQALVRAREELRRAGVHVKGVSGNFMTDPMGGGRQARYVNTVILATTDAPPARLLRLFKHLERAAGRRLGRHWGPRPLDIDLLDVRRTNNWRRRIRGVRRAGQIILPHPELHRRAFVLVPLAELAPHWVHPVLGVGAKRLLAQPSVRVQLRGIRRSAGAPS
jgi:2-amino-4-hydroxy-6-hydroxymethyldihydropteridine diphosphokinase